jgi:leader peptidase (prepilin peptidase)/N-methyltransferase
MIFGILFVFGLVFGSFFNVVALRYDGDHFVFDAKMLGGRSHCPHCKTTLRWFELIPVLSFIALGGRCRHCKKKISFAYPLVEIITGFIFLLVPWYILSFFPLVSVAHPMVLAALWIAAFCALLLLAYIDVLQGIMPDELTFIFGILAFVICAVQSGAPLPMISFLGPYAVLFGLINSFWISRMVGALFGFLFFLMLLLATRGRGMGWGDVKLALPLGLLFGWPDVLLVCAIAFVIGALTGIIAILDKKKTMKGTLPFGPFLAVGAAFVFFWGAPLIAWYFHVLGIG